NYYVAAANEFGDDIYNKRFYLVHNCNEALSVVFDFTPVVGGAKGLGEAYYGKDLVTEEDLAWWQRCIAAGAIIPGAGPALKRISKAAKIVSKKERVFLKN
ncbi:MAG: pre-toxin TG domain-containing protein, partial [Oligoflexales bacterium]